MNDRHFESSAEENTIIRTGFFGIDNLTPLQSQYPEVVKKNNSTLTDLRSVKKNPKLHSLIERGRAKLAPDFFAFMPPTPNLVKEAITIQKGMYSNGSFVPGYGQYTHDILSSVHNPKDYARIDLIRRNYVTFPGRSISFFGRGTPSNFYHWTGETLTLLSLLNEDQIASVDNVIVFTLYTSMLKKTLKAFYPEAAKKCVAMRAPAYSPEHIIFKAEDHLKGSLKVPRPSKAPEGASYKEVPLATIAFLKQQAEVIVRYADQHQIANQEVLVVSRERSPGRQLENLSQIITQIASLTPRVIFSENMTYEEQVAAFRNAKVVIGQHGAGLANIQFCQPGAEVFEITSRAHVHRAFDFALLAAAAGAKFNVIVVDAVEDADAQLDEDVTGKPIPSGYTSNIRASEEAVQEIAKMVFQGFNRANSALSNLAKPSLNAYGTTD